MQEKLPIQPIPYYMIISKFSGKVLDAVDENVRLFFAFNTPTQQWCFEYRGNGYFSIVNRSTHEVLDVNMAGIDNGSLVHTWTNVNADNQLWKLEPLGNDLFRIRAKNSGRCLDIVNGSAQAQAELHIWDACKNDTQIWLIKQVFDEPMEESPSKPAQTPEQPQAKPGSRRRRRTAAQMQEAMRETPQKKRAPRTKTAATGRGRGKTVAAVATPEAVEQAVPVVETVPAVQPSESAPATDITQMD